MWNFPHVSSYGKLLHMAEIIQAPRPGKRSFRQLGVDMTPMVDLGFLLITFFIFSTTLDTPAVLKLVLPTDGPSTPIAQTKTLTILLNGEDRAVCYEGAAYENPILYHADMKTDATGLRDMLLRKQQMLRSVSGNADAMIVVIKPTPQSTYRQLVAALDEMAICGVKKYVVANMDNDDQLLVSSQ